MTGRLRWRVALALAASLLPLGAAGCGAEPKQFGETCSDSEKCEDGLFCAKGTKAKHTCTLTCGDPDPCPARFGNRAFCSAESVCVKGCTTSSSCPDGTVCSTTETSNFCIAE